MFDLSHFLVHAHRPLVAGAAFLLVSLGGSTVVGADEGLECQQVQGNFSAVNVPPGQCDSPVGFCTEGQLTGNLKGSYSLTMNTSAPTPEAEVPEVFFFTGVSEITTHMGDTLVGIDTGALNLSVPGELNSGKFSTLITFTEGALGHLWIRGTADLATGTVTGSYSGRVCEG